LSKYLKLYHQERDSLLQISQKGQGQNQYSLAVYATWSLSYAKLGLPARTFLQISSILHHEGISKEIFKRAAESEEQLDDPEPQEEVVRVLELLGKNGTEWNTWVFQTITLELQSYSLIEFDHQNHSYRIHPLVQHWSSTTIDKSQHSLQKSTTNIIGLSISWEFDTDNYQFRRMLMPHIVSCTVSLKPEEIDMTIASHLALVYKEQGQWKGAEALEMVVMDRRKQLQGEDHPDTLTSMASLSNTYWNLGQWKNAEALGVVVMDKRKLLLGEDHPHTLISMEELAVTYQSLGQWKNAEALEVVVIEKSKQLLGEDHPSTLLSMGNLANTYRSLGQ